MRFWYSAECRHRQGGHSGPDEGAELAARGSRGPPGHAGGPEGVRRQHTHPIVKVHAIDSVEAPTDSH